VPFVRFSRDKRGYEYLSLVQPASQRRGRPTPRVLYWYRTPPNVKVGRRPFDEFVRHQLERRYPEIAFDWEALANTPIPPPAADVERWRERRRQERAAKQAARAEAEAEASAAADEESGFRAAPIEIEPAEPTAGEDEEAIAPRSAAEAAIEAATEASEAPVATSESESSESEGESSAPATGRRRRRRRRRESRNL